MIVLDTHIWSWWVSGQHERLSPDLLEALATRAVELSDHHRDPFDRIIMSTALELDAQLASADGQFSAYPELTGRLLV